MSLSANEKVILQKKMEKGSAILASGVVKVFFANFDPEASLELQEKLFSRYDGLKRKNEWTFSGIQGALVLVKDEDDSLFFHVYELDKFKKQYHQELYDDFIYKFLSPQFHSFEMDLFHHSEKDGCVCGFQFAGSASRVADRFFDTVYDNLQRYQISKYKCERPKTEHEEDTSRRKTTNTAEGSKTARARSGRKEKRKTRRRKTPRKSGPNGSNNRGTGKISKIRKSKEPSSKKLLTGSRTEFTEFYSAPDVMTTQPDQKGVLSGPPPVPQDKRMFSGTESSKRSKKELEIKKMSGRRSNNQSSRSSSHVRPSGERRRKGLKSDTTMGHDQVIEHADSSYFNGDYLDANNIPREWKRILKKAGIRKRDLRNPAMQQMIREALEAFNVSLDVPDLDLTEEDMQDFTEEQKKDYDQYKKEKIAYDSAIMKIEQKKAEARKQDKLDKWQKDNPMFGKLRDMPGRPSSVFNLPKNGQLPQAPPPLPKRISEVSNVDIDMPLKPPQIPALPPRSKMFVPPAQNKDKEIHQLDIEESRADEQGANTLNVHGDGLLTLAELETGQANLRPVSETDPEKLKARLKANFGGSLLGQIQGSKENLRHVSALPRLKNKGLEHNIMQSIMMKIEDYRQFIHHDSDDDSDSFSDDDVESIVYEDGNTN